MLFAMYSIVNAFVSSKLGVKRTELEVFYIENLSYYNSNYATII
jgi:hypothetical protein